MKVLEHCKNKIKELDKEYDYRYDIEYFKKAVDVLQCEIYPIFPDDICYRLALLQNALTDDLEFEWYAPSDEYEEETIRRNVERTKLKISDFVDLIEVINDINSANRISTKLTKNQKATINSLLHYIFDMCCIYIEKMFLKENKICDGCNIIKKIVDLRYNCKFNEVMDNNNENEDSIKNKYALNFIKLFEEHINQIDEDWYYQGIEIEKINKETLNKLGNLVDEALIGTFPILDDNTLQLEKNWQFKKLSKDSWEYYIFALEYLRTIIVQLFSHKIIICEDICGEFEERIMNYITDGIVFCLSKGFIRSFGSQIENEEYIYNGIELDSPNFIIGEYFYNNLNYIWKSFKHSNTFTSTEKQYMLNCIKNVLEMLEVYLY